MADRERLEQLDARIKAAKGAAEAKISKPRADQLSARHEIGWRMVIELVVGLLIGFGIGFGLDRLFGTLPIFLVLFTMLGLAAGIKTMMRSAAELQMQSSAAAENEEEPKDGR